MKFFRNIKTRTKLILLVAVAVVSMVILAAAAILSIKILDTASTQLFNGIIYPNGILEDINKSYGQVRALVRGLPVAVINGDDAKIAQDLKDIDAGSKVIDEKIKILEEMLKKDTRKGEAIDLISNLRSQFKPMLPIVANISKFAMAKDSTQLAQVIAKDFEPLDEVLRTYCNHIIELVSANIQLIKGINARTTSLAFLVTSICFGLGAIIIILLASIIVKSITIPLIAMRTALNEIGVAGNLNLPDDVVARFNQLADGKDEVADTLVATRTMYQRLNGVRQEIMAVADGDLTIKVNIASEKDDIGIALKKLVAELNSTFTQISDTSIEVAQNSHNVSDSSMSLAQGATEQTAAVAALSKSIAMVADKTQEAAEMALNASTMGDTIRRNAEVGTQQMDNMMQAVKDINDASASIGKVMKVIDDIAFQTNILALNAAVEAARAGQHGKGFAVVAEEVRNLAAKSAEAAKETGALIENSIGKAELGAKIANNTAESLGEIVNGINESSKLVNVIAQTSQAQTKAIREINSGVQEVGEVVSLISRGAELSSNAATSMKHESDSLHHFISQFKLVNDSAKRYDAVATGTGFSMSGNSDNESVHFEATTGSKY